MNVEKKRERIREFFDLIECEHYELRKFSHPALVFKVDDEKVYYSLWEEDLLNRFGLENVDGWDYTEDILFCPDWIRGDDDGDDLDDDDEPLDAASLRKYIDVKPTK
ncbi:MAG: hypothetical protein K8R90_04660 [Candidatus Cloacimonetes bacterium]|nr:hypothetical protein [Candidatus Cloacimonadota bacterium]